MTSLNLFTASASDLEALRSKGAQWLVVVRYDYGSNERKDVISWHKSHEAACRSCRNNTFVEIVDINEAVTDAKYNDCI